MNKKIPLHAGDVKNKHQYQIWYQYMLNGYAGSVTMTYEPPLEDDTALDKDGDCEYCGNYVIECTCNSEPDRMYGSED